MALSKANLKLIADAGGGFKLWHYHSADALAAITASGYFDSYLEADSSATLVAGDMILVNAGDGQAVLRVDAVASGVVTTEMGYGETQWLTALMADVSSAGSVHLAAPFDGKVRRVKTVLQGAISGADATVTVKIGGTPVTGGALTIAQSGSGAGDVDETTATGANDVSEGDAIEVATDGASTGAVGLLCMVEIVPA